MLKFVRNEVTFIIQSYYTRGIEVDKCGKVCLSYFPKSVFFSYVHVEIVIFSLKYLSIRMINIAEMLPRDGSVMFVYDILRSQMFLPKLHEMVVEFTLTLAFQPLPIKKPQKDFVMFSTMYKLCEFKFKTNNACLKCNFVSVFNAHGLKS